QCSPVSQRLCAAAHVAPSARGAVHLPHIASLVISQRPLLHCGLAAHASPSALSPVKRHAFGSPSSITSQLAALVASAHAWTSAGVAVPPARAAAPLHRDPREASHAAGSP